MRPPFPGMDPWLQHPTLWPDVHNSLIAGLANALGPAVRPKYVVRLEERVYEVGAERHVVVGRPDIVRETWLQVRSATSGEAVTVLEILSPNNKSTTEGRSIYESKRHAVLATRTNLVEIDLLRSGRPMAVDGPTGDPDYRILVCRGERRPDADLYGFSVRDSIPRFSLPLRPGDDEPTVDLGDVLAGLYDRAAYDLSVDYDAPPMPLLEPEDVPWAAGRVAEWRSSGQP